MQENFEFVDPVETSMMMMSTPPRQLSLSTSSRSSSVNSNDVNTPSFYEDTSSSLSNDPYSTPFVQKSQKRKREMQVSFRGDDSDESPIF